MRFPFITQFASGFPSNSHPVSTSLLSSTMDVQGIGAITSSLASLSSTPADILHSGLLGSMSLRGVQKVGENLFAAMLIIAFLQAMVALVQYRTNPIGQLIAPPGYVESVKGTSMCLYNTKSSVSLTCQSFLVVVEV
jgi:hypothetical protein